MMEHLQLKVEFIHQATSCFYVILSVGQRMSHHVGAHWHDSDRGWLAQLGKGGCGVGAVKCQCICMFLLLGNRKKNGNG